jgi:regulator of RNase E activity RraA
MFTTGEIITVVIAVIGWTGIVIGGVVRYVRAENRKLLDTTLESMRFQLRSEMQTIRADFYRDFHKVDRG